MKFFILLSLLISLPLSATTFRLQSAEQQLKAADGIILGHYLRSKSIKLEDGKIATQMIFKMDKELGMQSDFFGMDEVIVHYPGGKLGDVRVEIQGVPRFIPGEKVVIFTKSVQSRYWGLNLGMGTYKVVNYGEEKVMVNSLFPHHPQMGQVKLEDFEKSVRTIKGDYLKVVRDVSYVPDSTRSEQVRAPATATEAKIRTIASEKEEVDNYAANSTFQSFWLVALLAFLGSCFRFVQNRSRK